MGAQVVTVNDVLDGHVKLDIQCLDRIYVNAYEPPNPDLTGPAPTWMTLRPSVGGDQRDGTAVSDSPGCPGQLHDHRRRDSVRCFAAGDASLAYWDHDPVDRQIIAADQCVRVT